MPKNSYDDAAFGESEPSTEWEANLTLAKPVPSWQDESPNKGRILTNEKKPRHWVFFVVAAVVIALSAYVAVSAYLS